MRLLLAGVFGGVQPYHTLITVHTVSTHYLCPPRRHVVLRHLPCLLALMSCEGYP
jgi:hypothetical protein